MSDEQPTKDRPVVETPAPSLADQLAAARERLDAALADEQRAYEAHEATRETFDKASRARYVAEMAVEALRIRIAQEAGG